MKEIKDIYDNIYHGKWEDLIDTIPSNSIDLIVTSPPYNVNLGSNKHKKDKYDSYDDNMPYDDYLDWIDKLFTECYRALKPDGRICINIGDGANGAVPTHADFTIRMRDKHKFIPMTTIVWDKNQIGASTAWGSWKSPSCPSFPTQFEFIIVMAKGTTKHEGDADKITVTGDNFIRNSRALWKFPPETAMMKKYGHPACVDEKTECLTQTGWKTNRSLSIGDKIASYNCITKKLEWNEVLSKTEYNHDGEAYAVNGRHIDFILSGIHNCVILGKNDKIHLKFAKDLKGGDKIPCSAGWNEKENQIHGLTTNGSYRNIDANFSYLLGFFIGDGHYRKDSKCEKIYNIVIDQSLTKNLKKSDKIRKALDSFGADYKINIRSRKYSYKDKNEIHEHISFNIKGELRDLVCSFLKAKKKIPYEVLMWREDLLKSFMNGLMDSDGCRRSKGNIIFTQKDKDVLDMVHAIGIRLGYDAFLQYPKKGYSTGYVEFTSKSHKLLRNAKGSIIKKVKYKGKMWCPFVENNHTFVARRNGKVFITGNCFPEELPKRLIDQLTYKGDVVFDPFSGAGTTCAVAKQMGRHYIGFEMSEKYYNISNERLSLIPELDGNLPKWMQ